MCVFGGGARLGYPPSLLQSSLLLGRPLPSSAVPLSIVYSSGSLLQLTWLSVPSGDRPAPLWTPLIRFIAVPRRIWVTDRAETPAPRAAVLAQVEENHRGQRRVRQPLRLGVRAARVLFRRPRPLPAPGPGQVVEPREARRLSRLLGARSILLLVHPLASRGPGRSEEGERRPSEEVSSRNRGTPAGKHVGGSRELAEPPGGTVQPCSPCPQGHAARGAPGQREAPPGESPASPGFPGAPRLASRLPLTLFRLLRFAPRLRLPELALPSAKQSPRDGGKKRGHPVEGKGPGRGAPSSLGAAGEGSKGSASSRLRARGSRGEGRRDLFGGGFGGGGGRLLPPPRGGLENREGRGDGGGPSRAGVEAEMSPPPPPPPWLPLP